MNLFEILYILSLHFVADFVLQDRKWAEGKSHSWEMLLDHTVVYTFAMWIGAMIPIFIQYGAAPNTIYARVAGGVLITFVLHTMTDYITSREVRKMYEAKSYGTSIPNWGMFTLIGLDQLSHYIQLFATYYWIK